jgi:hypothetical protein
MGLASNDIKTLNRRDGRHVLVRRRRWRKRRANGATGANCELRLDSNLGGVTADLANPRTTPQSPPHTYQSIET